MSEQNRGKEDRLGGTPPSPLKSTSPTPVGTPSGTRSASSRPIADQFSDVDAAAAKALGVVPPVSEPGGAAGAAAPMEEENVAAAADADDELDLTLSGEEGATAAKTMPPPPPVKPDPSVQGFVEFYFENPHDVAKIPHWRAMGAFHDGTLEVAEMPALPTDGSGCNPNRTMFQFYMDHNYCVFFMQANPTVTVLDDDGIERVMLTRVRKCLPEAPNRFENKVPTSFLEEEAVYLEMFLNKGYQFNAVTKNMVVKRLEEWGLTVYRSSRMQVKMPKNPDDLEEGYLNLGADLRTNKMNILVKPIGMGADEYEWWKHPTIDVTDEDGITHYIRYRIGGPKAKVLCSNAWGCKRKQKSCRDGCDEVALERKMRAQSFSPGEGRKGGGAERKRQRDASSAEALTALFAQSRKLSKTNGNDVSKHHSPCPHFDAGKCSRGRNCGFKHEGGAEDWRKKPCKLAARRSGPYPCIGGAFCCYGHEDAGWKTVTR